MDHRVNARIDESLSRKLAHLRRITGHSVTEIVRQAIELYYESIHRGDGTAKDVLLRTGFVGCAEGSPDLSDRYKSAIAESLVRKA